ncbi:hypothetical protein MJ584_13375 [Klebsiella pneumoniae]|nr:hypothetical protein MJ584_13375 [Klebsiella pneumoniae]
MTQKLTPALTALYRDGTCRSRRPSEGTEAALSRAQRVGRPVARRGEQIAAGRQPLGTPTVDERGHYAERVDFSPAVATPAHWSAETPNCYRAVNTLWRGDELLEAEEGVGHRFSPHRDCRRFAAPITVNRR